MKRRWLSALLALCMVFSLLPASVLAVDREGNTLTALPNRIDVLQLLYTMAGTPRTKTSAAEISRKFLDVGTLTNDQLTALAWAVDQGLVDAELDQLAEPNSILHRGAVLSLFYKAAGSPKTNQTMDYSQFMDLDPNSWYFSAVNWAVTEGILVDDSYADPHFGPTDLPGAVEVTITTNGYQLHLDRYNEDGLSFAASGDALIVTGCAEDVVDLEIPEFFLDLPVARIASNAFVSHSNLESVYIPGTVQSIGVSAFEGCSALQFVYLDYGVQSIEAAAFYRCRALEWIVLPDSITTIGRSVFAECTSLTYLRVPKLLTTVSGDLCRGCQSLAEVVLSENITRIDENAFADCVSLEAIYYTGSEQRLNAVEVAYAGNNVLEQVTWYLLPSMPDAVYGLFDIPEETNWAYPGIAFCLDNGIMNGMGDGLFQPEGSTTRAQLVTILYRLMGEPNVSGWTPFTDLNQSWYQNAVLWAYQNKIVNGMDFSTFEPDTPVTREMMVTILHRLSSEYLNLNISGAGSLWSFPDSGNVSDWARTAVNWAVSAGIISGVGTEYGTILQPQGTATRAQIAKVIMTYCVEILDSVLDPIEGAPAA